AGGNGPQRGPVDLRLIGAVVHSQAQDGRGQRIEVHQRREAVVEQVQLEQHRRSAEQLDVCVRREARDPPSMDARQRQRQPESNDTTSVTAAPRPKSSAWAESNCACGCAEASVAEDGCGGSRYLTKIDSSSPRASRSPSAPSSASRRSSSPRRTAITYVPRAT